MRVSKGMVTLHRNFRTNSTEQFREKKPGYIARTVFEGLRRSSKLFGRNFLVLMHVKIKNSAFSTNFTPDAWNLCPKSGRIEFIGFVLVNSKQNRRDSNIRTLRSIFESGVGPVRKIAVFHTKASGSSPESTNFFLLFFFIYIFFFFFFFF